MKVDSKHGNITKVYCPATLCNILNDFRKKRKFCDMVIEVDKVEYNCHKLILVGFSRFFEGMFSENFLEAKEMRVNLSSISGGIINQILDYAYTGIVELTKDCVMDILHAANFLQAGSLFKECRRFLKTNIDSKNCFEIWRLSEVYSSKKLRKRSKKYILANFTKLSHELEFLKLESEKLLEIVSNDNVNVEKEEIVFDAIIRWFNFKAGEREVSLEKVLSQVRLAHLDPDFLISRVLAIEAVRKSSLLMRLVEEAKTYILLPFRRLEFQSAITRRRYTSSHSECIVVNRKSCSGEFWTIDSIFLSEDGRVDPILRTTYLPPEYSIQPHHDGNFRMNLFAEMNEQLKGFSAENLKMITESRPRNAVVGDVGERIYGLLQMESTPEVTESVPVSYKDVSRFDPSTNTWNPVAPLPDVVFGPVTVSAGGFFYVFGSLHRRKVYMYDCGTREWRQCAESTNQLDSGFLAVMNGRLFAISKRADDKRVIERYTPTTDSWQEFALCPGWDISCIVGPVLCRRERLKAKGGEVLKLLLRS